MKNKKTIQVEKMLWHARSQILQESHSEGGLYITGDDDITASTYQNVGAWLESEAVQAHFAEMKKRQLFIVVVTDVRYYNEAKNSGHIDYLLSTGFVGAFRFEFEHFPEVYPGISYFEVGDILQLKIVSEKIKHVEKMVLTDGQRKSLIDLLLEKYSNRKKTR